MSVSWHIFDHMPLTVNVRLSCHRWSFKTPCTRSDLVIKYIGPKKDPKKSIFNFFLKFSIFNLSIYVNLFYIALYRSIIFLFLRKGEFVKNTSHWLIQKYFVSKMSWFKTFCCVFRLKNHLLFYYQQDSLPILDKNVAGVIVLLNVFISRGLMTSIEWVLSFELYSVNRIFI